MSDLDHVNEAADQRLSLCEQAIWALVSQEGPDPALAATINAALGGKPYPPTASEELAELHQAITDIIEDSTVSEVLAHHVLTDAYRVACVAWDAYQDGFDAGLTRGRLEALNDRRRARSGPGVQGRSGREPSRSDDCRGPRTGHRFRR